MTDRRNGLPGRPCGRWIAYLIREWSHAEWPPPIIEIVSWYATNDPDPAEEEWRKRAPSGQLYDGGDPEFSGPNTTRGAAANAIAHLLFAGQVLEPFLVHAVEHVAHDASIAVRSQAAAALLALLDIRPELAIRWFVECVSLDPILLSTGNVEQFIRYAGYRDYAAIRPVLRRIIASDDEKTIATGARLCCLFGLNVELARSDAEQVSAGLNLLPWVVPGGLPRIIKRSIVRLRRSFSAKGIGSSARRMAAATVYAANVEKKDVGAECRELLLPFFADSDEDVRAAAARAFQRIAKLETADQSEMLAAFLAAKPSANALVPVIRALEESSVRLPSLVCRLAEVGIEAFRTDAGDIRTRGALVAGDLSKIVIRLYTQSDDDEIKKRCLNAIDTMEQAGFLGLSDELGKLER